MEKKKTWKAKLLISCYSESSIQKSRTLWTLLFEFLEKFSKQKEKNINFSKKYIYFLNSENWIVWKCNSTLLFKSFFNTTSWMAWNESNETKKNNMSKCLYPTQSWNSSQLSFTFRCRSLLFSSNYWNTSYKYSATLLSKVKHQLHSQIY